MIHSGQEFRFFYCFLCLTLCNICVTLLTIKSFRWTISSLHWKKTNISQLNVICLTAFLNKSRRREVVWGLFCENLPGVSVRRELCVMCMRIWRWRHCSRPLSSPTIMCWSGLTHWALWRLVWRWWGWRACLSSWSVCRSCTKNQETTESDLRSVAWTANVPPHTWSYFMKRPSNPNSWQNNTERHSVWRTIRWGGEGGRRSAVRTDSSGDCFDSTVSLCNKIYHRELICWWALVDAKTRLTVAH